VLAIVRSGDREVGSNVAVAATPGNVYVIALGGLGFGKVKRVVAKIPIAQTTVDRTGSQLVIGRRGQPTADYSFAELPGAAPKRVAEYVLARGGTSAL
jgi:hypothetical protein